MPSPCKRHLSALCVLLMCITHVFAQEIDKRLRGSAIPPVPSELQQPNTHSDYKALRNISSGETFQLKDFLLHRDAGFFTLSGSVVFLAPVNGKVTGAVFFGKGTFSMVPPLDVEKKNLTILTKEAGVHEEFNKLVLRFTDNTYEEIRKSAQPGGSSGGDPAEALASFQKWLRKEDKYNLDGRILQDVLSNESGGLFWAFIEGTKVSKKMLFAIDPHGLSDLSVAPEEMALMTYDDNKFGVWCSFHYAEEYGSGRARGSQYNLVIDVDHQKLDTTIDRTGKLDGIAMTTFSSTVDGLRVLPFDLFHTLRVRNVLDASGKPLDFIQENKDEDSDFYVILPKPMAKGEQTTITTFYSGKDAVIDAGFGNYFPVARDDWYPNTKFGDYATYEMTFRVPKDLSMVATGMPGKSTIEGVQSITEWVADVPQAVAGFNFATYTRQEATLEGEKYKIEGYANTKDESFASMLKREVAEAQLAVQLYTDFYGPAPYHRLAVTEQPTNLFGQSWPALIYLPHASFQDVYGSGLNAVYHGFWRTVASHEVAHQWFGHAVGIPSYRDNWLSEGFAEFSASLYLEWVYKEKPEVYSDFWKGKKSELLQKNKEGKRPIDVGSVFMGHRLGNTKTGLDIGELIYPKGAYILHMVRMMMLNPQTEDADFKALMHDYVQTYYNRASSTEDFKATLEKHMTPTMNLRGDGKMDWFFDEYVYGTAMPDYKFDYSFEPIVGGFMLNATITQSNVDDKFAMLVPLYLDLGNNKVVKLGNVKMLGNSTKPIKLPLTGIEQAPKRALINYNYDVLATLNGK